MTCMKVKLSLIFYFICVFLMDTSFAIDRPPMQDNVYWTQQEFRTHLPDPFGYCELVITEMERGVAVEVKVLGKTIPLRSKFLKSLHEISMPEITFNHFGGSNSDSVSFYFEVGPMKKIDEARMPYSKDDWARDIVEFRIDASGNVKSKLFRVDELGISN